jgi:hypothetical protein
MNFAINVPRGAESRPRGEGRKESAVVEKFLAAVIFSHLS